MFFCGTFRWREENEDNVGLIKPVQLDLQQAEGEVLRHVTLVNIRPAEICSPRYLQVKISWDKRKSMRSNIASSALEKAGLLPDCSFSRTVTSDSIQFYGALSKFLSKH